MPNSLWYNSLCRFWVPDSWCFTLGLTTSFLRHRIVLLPNTAALLPFFRNDDDILGCIGQRATLKITIGLDIAEAAHFQAQG